MCAILPESVDVFKKVCNRERCPFGVVGDVTTEEHLKLIDGNAINQ